MKQGCLLSSPKGCVTYAKNFASWPNCRGQKALLGRQAHPALLGRQAHPALPVKTALRGLAGLTAKTAHPVGTARTAKTESRGATVKSGLCHGTNGGAANCGSNSRQKSGANGRTYVAPPVQDARLSAPAASTYPVCQRPPTRNHRISWSSKTATGVWQRTSKCANGLGEPPLQPAGFLPKTGTFSLRKMTNQFDRSNTANG